MRRILFALTLAAYPIGGVLADAQTSNNAKVTLVYEHELPNVPGKSLKGVLVEYGPGGSSVPHTHPASAFIYATVLEGAIAARSMTGRRQCTRAGQNWSPSCPAIVTPSAAMQARPAGQLLAVFVVDTTETNLVTPY